MSGDEKLEKRLEQLGRAMAGRESMAEEVMGRIERLEAGTASSRGFGSHTKIWRNIMNARFIKYAAAAVVVIGVVGLFAWLMGGNGGASITFAQVIEPIRQAQSLSYTETNQPEEGAAYVIRHVQSGPGRVRRTSEDGQVRITITDHSLGQIKGLVFDPATKTAYRSDTPFSKAMRVAHTPVREVIEELKNVPDEPEENLGTKEIDGRKAVGFRVRRGYQNYDVWADARTGAPVRIECYTLSDGRKRQTTITDIEINAELDESLFSLDPPEGEGYNIEWVQD